MIIQQGDVLFKSTTIPNADYEVIKDPIVQHGEATGHKHMLMFRHDDMRTAAAPDVSWEILKNKVTGVRFLKVTEPTDLTHEEHNKITIPPGEYEIAIVREYDHFAEEARQVVD